MKGLRLIRTATGIAMAAVVAAMAFGQDADRQPEAQKQTAFVASQRDVAQAGQLKRVIVVSLEDRKLALIEGGRVVKVYAVAVGKPSTPSPVGTFVIKHRVANPTYYHAGKVIPPGPGNPVGNRWVGLSIPGYGIHGTNAPSSVGKAASHGCIRMGKDDIDDLFNRVQVGDTVELLGQRNAETAQLFGDGPKLPASQPGTETAHAVPAAKPASPAAPNQAEVLTTSAKAGPATAADKNSAGAL